MTGQIIPADDHVVRTVGKDKWDEVQTESGTTVKFLNDVFLPREDHPPGTGPEECVSVDWPEYFSGTLPIQLRQVRDAVAARRQSGKVGKQAQFAVVVVGDVHAAAKKGGKQVRVKTTGDETDPSHSGIYGLEPYDHIISQEIARLAHAYRAYPANP